MSDDKPRPRERRYAILSKETIRMHSESVGITDLSEEVTDLLAEDVSYRLRDVIQVVLFIVFFINVSLILCELFS